MNSVSAILRDWFDASLKGIECSPEVRAYVIDVLAHQGGEQVTGSIVLKLNEIRYTGDFRAHQKLGDWVLWSAAVTPDSHRDVTFHVGSVCYATCHRILRHAWPLYEELSSEFPRITLAVTKRLKSTSGSNLIQPNLKVHINNE